MEKGNEDGLYISCVASAANLWALIMDAGTGFSSQVYELSSVFLHKVAFPSNQHLNFFLFFPWKDVYPNGILCFFYQDWIMEQWEKSYYISSIAGAANGSSLVIMSKGWLKVLSGCVFVCHHYLVGCFCIGLPMLVCVECRSIVFLNWCNVFFIICVIIYFFFVLSTIIQELLTPSSHIKLVNLFHSSGLIKNGRKVSMSQWTTVGNCWDVVMSRHFGFSEPVRLNYVVEY